MNELGVPFTSMALDLGNERVINTLALGVVIKRCPIVSPESIRLALGNELPAKVLELNLKAFEQGNSLGINES